MTDDRLLLDGHRLTDTERLKLLREEYAALGMDNVMEARNGLVSTIVSTRLSMVATAPRREAAPSAAAQVPRGVAGDGPLDCLAQKVLARVMWDQRGMET